MTMLAYEPVPAVFVTAYTRPCLWSCCVLPVPRAEYFVLRLCGRVVAERLLHAGAVEKVVQVERALEATAGPRPSGAPLDLRKLSLDYRGELAGPLLDRLARSREQLARKSEVPSAGVDF